MRIALAQLNPVVGDVAGNTKLFIEAIDRARALGADLLVGAELGLLGYPPRDLLLRHGVIEACAVAVRVIAERAGPMAVVVGHPRRDPDGVRGVRNSASVRHDGKVLAVYDKRLLPGYDVFDEDRYFDPGAATCLVDLPFGRLGVLICEDLWRGGDVPADPHYAADPLADLARQGCDVVANLNASPFVLGKWTRHLEQIREGAKRHGLPIVAVNQVGGNDDLVFDGRSMLVGADGRPRCVLDGWVSTVEIADVAAQPVTVPAASAMSDLFHALVLGVRDYCHKTRHTRVLIGLSGGIDSALTATIAAAALGPQRVQGVIMPSRYSAPESAADAEDLAKRLDLLPCEHLDIRAAHETLRDTLMGTDPDGCEGVTDENLQARIRGALLMARSNTTGALLLATSNKSELAVGYSTLYGDMCGALSVIGDVLKTQVYTLARWINEHPEACGCSSPPIPPRSIERAPTAELRPNQTDQDTLPPYEILDAIIDRVVCFEHAAEQIIDETNIDAALVRDIVRRIDLAEYKRHQASIILKVSPRTFGRGRPMPLAMRATEIGARAARVEHSAG